MDPSVLEERYLKDTKRFAKLSGVWPYQTKWSKYFMRTVVYLTTSLSIVTQIARVACFYTTEVLLEELPFIAAAFGILAKQVNYVINEEKVKSLLSGMYKDWVTNRSKEEIDILTKYAERASLFSMIYIRSAYFCVIFFVNLPYVPRILDKVMPKNESRGAFFIYPAYYAIDEEKYFYLIIAHMSLAIVVVLFVFAAVDTNFIYAVQHACGLLIISGHRFKNAIDGDRSARETKKVAQQIDEINWRVCHSIQAHERALEHLRDIDSSHVIYLFIFMGLVTTTFSGTLLKLSAMEDNTNVEFYFYFTFLLVQLMHLFFIVFQGQFVIDSNDEVYNKIYEALWYNAPVKTQALYRLALRKTLTPPEITAGGIVTLNLATFSDILKTSVSYFTVLKST